MQRKRQSTMDTGGDVRRMDPGYGATTGCRSLQRQRAGPVGGSTTGGARDGVRRLGVPGRRRRRGEGEMSRYEDSIIASPYDDKAEGTSRFEDSGYRADAEYRAERATGTTLGPTPATTTPATRAPRVIGTRRATETPRTRTPLARATGTARASEHGLLGRRRRRRLHRSRTVRAGAVAVVERGARRSLRRPGPRRAGARPHARAPPVGTRADRRGRGRRLPAHRDFPTASAARGRQLLVFGPGSGCWRWAPG